MMRVTTVGAEYKPTKEDEEIIDMYNHQSYLNQEFYKNLAFEQ